MIYDVRNYGAVGDGVAADGQSIQKAINAAGEAGGGRVVLPAGTWRSGMLTLRDHVDLHLHTGAVLLAADDVEAYDDVDHRRDAHRPLQAMLFADRAEHIAITGTGVIDGGGGPQPLDWQAARELALRPVVLLWRDCRHVRICDLTIRHAQNWTLHLKRCEHVRISGVTMQNNWPNSDGIDPDGCRHVVISDCDITAGDDCIVLKSTEGDPCENVVVNNCILRTNCAALKLGTESIGPIRNVVVNGCVALGVPEEGGTGVGFGLYMKDGGTFENIVCSNLVVHNGSQFPILIDITPRFAVAGEAGEGCEAADPSGDADLHAAPGRIRRVRFENCIVCSPGRLHIEGTAACPVEEVAIRGLQWHATGPLVTDVFKPAGAARVSHDPDRINHAATAHLISAAHVQGLSLHDVGLTWADGIEPDRELLYTHDVKDLRNHST